MSITISAVQAALGSTVAATAITALVTRRKDVVSGFLDAYGKLGERVVKLETRLDHVEEKYGAERDAHEHTRADLEIERTEHAHTRSRLRIAIDHVLEVVAWGRSDRSKPLPEPPNELVIKA